MAHGSLKIMEQAVLKAASRLLEAAHGRESVHSWRKADNTLVMSLDLECEKILLSALGTELPVLSEESPDTHSLLASEDRFFSIDPVDGTTACKRFLTVRGGQVGFGPLVGLFDRGRVQAAVFYNVPQRTLYSAEVGRGVTTSLIEDTTVPVPSFEDRTVRPIDHSTPLSQSAVLYFTGTGGESGIVERLKNTGLIENAYRFGGFANDCTRLACGYEEVQIQFSVKPWDLPAVLFEEEAGYRPLMDPLGAAVPFKEWRVQPENPLLSASPTHVDALLREVRAIAKSNKTP